MNSVKEMKDNVAYLIAQALNDASAGVVTNVPGFGGSQVFEALSTISSAVYLPSFHEEVAYSIAHGASLVGQRSATLIKAHGLAKAVNSVVDSLSTGVRAGFVVLVFDDKQGKHSDNIFDVAGLLKGLAIPFQSPKASGLYHEVINAFERSENLGLPVAVLIDCDDLARTETYTPRRINCTSLSYHRNVAQNVLCPFLVEYQRVVLTAKLAGHNWQALTPPVLPNIPDFLPPEWQQALQIYIPFFEAFRKLRGDVVVSDAGISTLFAFPPYDCIDICSYMGGSIPLAIGAYLAGLKDVWAITGDFSFIAAGHLGLLEARQRKIPLKVIILNNHRSQTTGGQPIPPGILETILQGYKPFLVTIKNPQGTKEVQDRLQEIKKADEMRIVVVDYQE
jgi:TPP-dependent indolepyruvate ferredoxin oxidoreductase alpha subunit